MVKRASPLAALLLLGGCSLLGLTDVTPQAPCRDCEELAFIDPPPVCQAWRCGPDDLCILDVEDADEDGVPRCAFEGPADCDDRNPLRIPGGVETCDGVDEDCDERVDEHLDWSASPVSLPDVDRAVLAESGAPLVTASLDADARPVVLVEGGAPAAVDGPAGVPGSLGLALDPTGPNLVYLDAACNAPVLARPLDAALAIPRRGGCGDPSTAPAMAVWEDRAVLLFAEPSLRPSLTLVRLVRDGGPWAVDGAPSPLGVHEGDAPPAALGGPEPVGLRRQGSSYFLFALDDGRTLVEFPCGETCPPPRLARIEGEIAVAFVDASAAPSLYLAQYRFAGSELEPDRILRVAPGPIDTYAIAGRAAEPRWAVAFATDGAPRLARVGDAVVGAPVPVDGRGWPESIAYDGAGVSIALRDGAQRSRVDVDCP